MAGVINYAVANGPDAPVSAATPLPTELYAAGLASLGFANLSGLSAVKGLGDVAGGIPTGSSIALIQTESNNVRWRDDGTAPTASVGMLLNAGKDMVYDGDLTAIDFIEVAASATLNIGFYG